MTAFVPDTLAEGNTCNTCQPVIFKDLTTIHPCEFAASRRVVLWLSGNRKGGISEYSWRVGILADNRREMKIGNEKVSQQVTISCESEICILDDQIIGY